MTNRNFKRTKIPGGFDSPLEKALAEQCPTLLYNKKKIALEYTRKYYPDFVPIYGEQPFFLEVKEVLFSQDAAKILALKKAGHDIRMFAPLASSYVSKSKTIKTIQEWCEKHHIPYASTPKEVNEWLRQLENTSL